MIDFSGNKAVPSSHTKPNSINIQPALFSSILFLRYICRADDSIIRYSYDLFLRRSFAGP